MNHTPVDLSPQEIANLRTHALALLPFLKANKWKGYRFTMAMYSVAGHFYDAGDCGSVGCSVGFATHTIEPKKRHEGYDTFGERIFGMSEHQGGRNNLAWQFLFSGVWAASDNTAKGACQRILYLLEHGLPENWKAQMFERQSLCYTDINIEA